MKVCMLTSGHSHMDNRVFFKEACTLHQAGHDVSLVVPLSAEGYFLDPMHQPISSLYPRTSFIENGIQIYGYQKKRRESDTMNPDEVRLQVLEDFIRFIEEDEFGNLEVDLIRKGMEIDADIYHAHEISSAYAAIKVKQLKEKEGKKVKVVYDVHEYFPSIYGDVVAGEDQYREAYREVIRKLERLFLHHSDLIITVSESIRDYLLQLYPHQNVHVIKNVPILKEQPKRNNRDNAFPLVCYEGYIRFERGLKELVEATEILSTKYPQFRLLMVGQAAGHEADFLHQAISEKQLHRHLVVTGWQTPEKAAEWLSHADIGIVFLIDAPYCRLTLSNKLFNYMRAGAAIIGMDYPDMGRIIKESGAGITISRFRTEELVHAVDELLRDREKLEELKEKSRVAYETTYNWNVEGRKFLRIYEELSGSAARREEGNRA